MIRAPFLRALRAVLRGRDNCAVDHDVFVVVIGGQMPENPLNHIAFTPAAQSSVTILPVAEMRRQITLGNTGSITIQYSFDKQTALGSRATNMAFTPRKKILYPLLVTIAYTITLHVSLCQKTGRNIIKRVVARGQYRCLLTDDTH